MALREPVAEAIKKQDIPALSAIYDSLSHAASNGCEPNSPRYIGCHHAMDRVQAIMRVLGFRAEPARIEKAGEALRKGLRDDLRDAKSVEKTRAQEAQEAATARDAQQRSLDAAAVKVSGERQSIIERQAQAEQGLKDAVAGGDQQAIEAASDQLAEANSAEVRYRQFKSPATLAHEALQQAFDAAAQRADVADGALAKARRDIESIEAALARVDRELRMSRTIVELVEDMRTNPQGIEPGSFTFTNPVLAPFSYGQHVGAAVITGWAEPMPDLKRFDIDPRTADPESGTGRAYREANGIPSPFAKNAPQEA